MARITINGISLDPIAHAKALNVAGLESADASASDYILIQTIGPLSPDQADALAKLGVVEGLSAVFQGYTQPATGAWTQLDVRKRHTFYRARCAIRHNDSQPVSVRPVSV
jgi:hypothetical protein